MKTKSIEKTYIRVKRSSSRSRRSLAAAMLAVAAFFAGNLMSPTIAAARLMRASKPHHALASCRAAAQSDYERPWVNALTFLTKQREKPAKNRRRQTSPMRSRPATTDLPCGKRPAKSWARRPTIRSSIRQTLSPRLTIHTFR